MNDINCTPSPNANSFRVLLAPDKFKGTLSASEVVSWLQAGLESDQNEVTVSCRSLPLADGGDGSVQAALAAGFHPLTVPVAGPTGVRTETTLALNSSTAVVEVATTVGLKMLHVNRLAPLRSSSAGFGEAVSAAYASGAQRIVLALGGSATTDGGAGMLSALGAQFYDDAGAVFVPSGGTLRNIAWIDVSGLTDLSQVDLVAASDVQNPLLGTAGAAAVYGPQKGATPADIVLLEQGLGHLTRCLDEAGLPGASFAHAAGAGSAGGLGYAALLLGARLVSGAEFFMDLLGFDHALEDCNLVITGEGKMDGQTLAGKLPLVVARRSLPVPVIAVVGHNALVQDQLPEHNIEKIYSLSSMTNLDTSADAVLSANFLYSIGRQIAQSLKHAQRV